MNDNGFTLYVHGRLHGVTRKRLGAAVAQAGGRLVASPSSRVTLVAVGHSTAMVGLIEAPPIALPAGLSAGAELLSELGLKRRLGLAPPLADDNRTLSERDLAHAARLDPEVVRCLVLYDVLEPVAGQLGFRDLRAAREVKRLLDLDIALDEIVEAAVTLRHAGRGLSDTRLSEAPWGELVQEVAGRLGRLDGQYTLDLEEPFASVDEVFATAEQAESSGDLASAERCYRIALAMDRTDPVIPFNLGNVLEALGRPEEAALAFRQATVRDPTFAEAWLNLAALQESAGRVCEAMAFYARALEARPDYPEALHNLARMQTRQGSYFEALASWERYVALEPRPADRGQALRQMLLCRVAAHNHAGGSGDRPLVPVDPEPGLAS